MGVLIQAAGHGTLATNLFLGSLLDAPDSQIALTQTQGQPPIESMGDGTNPSIIRPGLQVWTRGAPEDYATPLATMRAVWKTLSGVANETINGTLYQRVAANSEPVLADRDDDRRCVFVCNFSVWKAVP